MTIVWPAAVGMIVGVGVMTVANALFAVPTGTPLVLLGFGVSVAVHIAWYALGLPVVTGGIATASGGNE